jgi:hypothetical protein
LLTTAAKTKATVASIVDAYTSVDALDNFAGLVAGDVTLYWQDVTGVTHFQLAKTFKGQLSKVTWNTDLQDYVYKISDTDYTRSGLDGTIAQEEIAHQGYNVDVNYYTDDFGYIVNAKAVKAALSDFVIALDFGSDNSKVFTSTPYVYLLKMDGTTEQVPVAALVDGTTTYTFTGDTASTPNTAADIANGNDNTSVTGKTTNAKAALWAEDNYDCHYYTYTKNAAGYYTLTLIQTSTEGAYNQALADADA